MTRRVLNACVLSILIALAVPATSNASSHPRNWRLGPNHQNLKCITVMPIIMRPKDWPMWLPTPEQIRTLDAENLAKLFSVGV